jgi:hypothetical protein
VKVPFTWKVTGWFMIGPASRTPVMNRGVMAMTSSILLSVHGWSSCL